MCSERLGRALGETRIPGQPRLRCQSQQQQTRNRARDCTARDCAASSADSWRRRLFVCAQLIAEEIPTLGGAGSSQVIVSELSLPAPSVDVLAPPLQQGSRSATMRRLKELA